MIMTNFAFYLNMLLRVLHIAYKVNYGGCLMLCAIIKREAERRGLKCDIIRNKGLHEECHYTCNLSYNNSSDYSVNYYPFAYYIPVGVVFHDWQDAMKEYQNGKWSEVYERKYDDVIQSIITDFIKNYEL